MNTPVMGDSAYCLIPILTSNNIEKSEENSKTKYCLIRVWNAKFRRTCH